MNFGQYRSHGIPIFISANMLYLKSVSMVMHDVLYDNKMPANISNFFTSVRELNMYNTRFSSTSNLYVRNSHKNNLKNSFSRAGVVSLTSCVILVKENLRKNCKKFYFLYLLRRMIMLCPHNN